MSKWINANLGDICDISIGRTPPRKESIWFSQTEGIPWISIADMGNAIKYITKTKEYLTEEAVSKFNVPIIKKNTVLLSFKMTVGRVAITDKEMLSNEAIAHMNNCKINTEFLYYYLKNFNYSSLASTSSIVKSAVNTKILKNIPVVYPENKNDQEKVTRFLSLIDEKIEINKKINKTLDEIAKTLFKSWFINFDPVRAKAEGRPTGLSKGLSDLFPSTFEDSELGEIPKGWNIKNLKDTSLHIESGTRPKGGIDKSLGEGVPSVGAESLQNIGTFDYSKIKFVKEEFAENVSRGWVQDYDVLIYKDGAKVGDPTRVGLYGNGFPFKKFLVNEHVFIIRSKELGQPFLYNLFKSDRLSNELKSMGTSKAAQPGLNQKEVLSCKFVAPPKDLIFAFNQTILESINQSLLLGLENQTLSELFELLLPKLISGELIIPDVKELIQEASI